MGRHSRKGPARQGDKVAAPPPGEPRADSTAARGVPDRSDATPAAGVPRVAQGPPPRGVPRYADGTPAQGVPRVRGGHPEQREAGGGWGTVPASGPAPAGHGAPAPGRRQVPGPRREYVDAFADGSPVPVATGHAAGARAPGPREPVPGPQAAVQGRYASGPYAAAGPTAAAASPSGPYARRGGPPPPGGPGGAPAADPYASVTEWDTDPAPPATDDGPADPADPRVAVPPPRHPGDGPPPGDGPSGKGGKGRTFTGIAAAAVTTVLAVVVAGQVADRDAGARSRTSATGEAGRSDGDPPSRSDNRPAPERPAGERPAAAPQTYAQKMGRTYPLDPELAASGEFEAIPGFVKAPGKGQVVRYRVDVEKGLGLDGALFADAVQKTLNDDRSWAHGGARSFERVSSGRADFVITLASPGTTDEWCAKSGLNTSIDNVSCDSASTERVMVNAYRWAQGSETYGDRIHAYRQMLINHEVGHRLGFGHVSCQTDGALAPVMQQQTKFLEHDGITCKANPWAFPKS
ncbi:DUF3152 domain-containing protein [Streptomyces uncialis]|uniref:DUF3152 domain-containing protein n=1 Tax=Streptomyces uncialis TaxID=1048205 RepID=UPI00381434C1